MAAGWNSSCSDFEMIILIHPFIVAKQIEANNDWPKPINGMMMNNLMNGRTAINANVLRLLRKKMV